MSGVNYDVSVNYLQTGALHMPSGIDSALSAGKRLESTYGKLGKTMSSGVSGAVDGMASIGGRLIDTMAAAAAIGGAALAAGLTQAIHTGLDFNEYKEGAIASLASIGAMIADLPFETGLQKGEESFERLRVAAKALPGEVKDSMNFMTSIAPVTIGVDVQRRENLASQGVAAAMALGVAQPVAARELASMLAGNARHSMPLFAKMGLGDAKQFNALSSAARFEKVEQQFAKLGPSIDYYAHTMAGLKSATADTAKNVLGIFTAPLYEKLKNSLEIGLAYFGKHEYAINQFASKLGAGVAWAYEAGLSYLTQWTPIAIDFGRHLLAGVRAAVDYLKPHLTQMKLAAEGLAITAVGARVASPAISATGALAGPALAATGISGFATAGIALVAAAAAALQCGTAMLVLSDTFGPFYDEANRSFDQIKFSFAGVADSMKRIWVATSPALIAGAELFGTIFLGIASITGICLDGIGKAFATFFEFLNTKIMWLAAKLGIDMTPREHADPRVLGYGPKELIRPLWDEDDGKNDHKVPHTQITNNINGTQIHVDGSADPGRVARLTIDLLLGMAKSPTKATGAPRSFTTAGY